MSATQGLSRRVRSLEVGWSVARRGDIARKPALPRSLAHIAPRSPGRIGNLQLQIGTLTSFAATPTELPASAIPVYRLLKIRSR